MPERRSWRRARSSSRASFGDLRVGLAIDEIAVEGELPDQRIDLAERQPGGLALAVAADEAVGRDATLERRRARGLDRRDAVALGEGEDPEDAADAERAVLLVDRGAER